MSHLSIFSYCISQLCFRKTKIKIVVAKTRTGPRSKKSKAAAASEPTAMGESADADNQSDVELDSLGRLFIELAETSYS